VNQRQLFSPGKRRLAPTSFGNPDTTHRSVRWLQGRGYLAAVAEKYDMIPHALGGKKVYLCGRRQDLWGFCDVLAIREGSPILAVQACQKGEEADHIRRYREWPPVADSIRTWLALGCELVIHAWYAAEVRGKNGKIKVEWRLNERPVTAADLIEEKF
jgi:hypothetical protein